MILSETTTLTIDKNGNVYLNTSGGFISDSEIISKELSKLSQGAARKQNGDSLKVGNISIAALIYMAAKTQDMILSRQ